jgi:hypothetical protein
LIDEFVPLVLHMMLVSLNKWTRAYYYSPTWGDRRDHLATNANWNARLKGLIYIIVKLYTHRCYLWYSGLYSTAYRPRDVA